MQIMVVSYAIWQIGKVFPLGGNSKGAQFFPFWGNGKGASGSL